MSDFTETGGVDDGVDDGVDEEEDHQVAIDGVESLEVLDDRLVVRLRAESERVVDLPVVAS